MDKKNELRNEHTQPSLIMGNRPLRHQSIRVTSCPRRKKQTKTSKPFDKIGKVFCLRRGCLPVIFVATHVLVMCKNTKAQVTRNSCTAEPCLSLLQLENLTPMKVGCVDISTHASADLFLLDTRP